MRIELLDILKKEIKPALGCTGPISVAFATSTAKDIVGGTPRKIRVIMDKDTYKNSVAVVTPGTNFKGVLEPAVLGAFYGQSTFGLEVLKNMKNPDEDKVREFAQKNTTIEIKWEYKGMGVYIEVYIETENGIGHVIVAKSHDNVVLAELNGKIVYKEEGYNINDLGFENNEPIRNYCVKDFYEFSKSIDIEKIMFLKEALELNKALSSAGMKEEMGAKFGLAFEKFNGNKTYLRAKMLAASASDARMAGKNLSAMSCAKSGNVGITASLPLTVIAEDYGKSEEELLRAVSLSYLLTIYIKSHIGRLSAMCACAIAAGIGIAAGTSFLIDNDLDKIEMSIKNIVGSIGGVLCDGAKYGCALRLSAAVGIAIESAWLSNIGVCIPDRDGLVCDNADETIALLGRIASKGMLNTDVHMCKEIIERENRLTVK